MPSGLDDPVAFRGEFPVLDRLAYLNAGTDGPLPARAIQAARAELERQLTDGRFMAHFQRRFQLMGLLREGYARLLGCEAGDVALTTSTSEGVAQVVSGLGLHAGREIVTSDEEHPGLLGALAGARDVHGVTIKVVPFAEVANAVGPQTALVACSHVSWITGALAPAELAQLDVPVVLDGAQGLGAVPIDLSWCDAYAAAGQKWLCGPDGSGVLYVSERLREQLAVERRGYINLAMEPGLSVLDAPVQPDARRFDSMALSAESLACAHGALQLLEQTGWPAVHTRSAELAAQLAGRLTDAGRDVAVRGPTTLVSFASQDPEAERAQLSEAGVVLRNLPGHPWLRASVGAWNDERDLDRLLGALN